MAQSTRIQGVGAYANLCLTVIAGCLIFLCNRMSVLDPDPERVEIVGIASNLSAPLPCKLMYKKESRYSTEWSDDGTLEVRLAGGEKPQRRMQVEIVEVASNIGNALPIKGQQEKEGLFGTTPSKNEAVAVRLVGIERPEGHGEWHAIPVRGPAVLSGELGAMIGSYPVDVKVAR